MYESWYGHMCVCVCYLSMLHYDQPSLEENCDSFCTAMSDNATGLVLNQHSEWTLLSVTHVLLAVKAEEREDESFIFYFNAVQHHRSGLSISHLDQDILAEAGEGVLEAVKGDVMALPNSAAHTITQLLSAAPLSVLAHAAKTERLLSEHGEGITFHSHQTRAITLPGVAVHRDGCSWWMWLVVMVTGTLLRCNAVSAVTYLKSSLNQSLFKLKMMSALSATRTVPGGQRQPGMQERLTQGRSRFWQVLAHSRPFSPALHSPRTNGGGHRADRRSAYKKTPSSV